MKKFYRIIILIFILCFPVHNYAQFDVGVRGGINICTADFNPIRNINSYITGKHIGVLFRYISPPHFGVQTEINYSTKGWRELFLFNQENIGREVYAKYIEVPIMTHFDIGRRNNKAIIHVGSYIDYYLNQKEMLEIDYKLNKALRTEDFKDISYGLVAGLGFEKKSPIGTFQFEGRFYHSFTNVLQKEKDISTYFSQYQIVGFSLSYIFDYSYIKKEETKK
jgi:hypothetical protein